MYGALAKATQLADFAYSSQVRSVTVAKLNCDSLTASRALRKVKSLMGRGGRSRSNQPHSMISRGSGGCEGNAANSSARNTKWCIPLSGRHLGRTAFSCTEACPRDIKITRGDAQFLVHFAQCALKSGLADLAVASRYLPVLPAVVVMHEKNQPGRADENDGSAECMAGYRP